MYSYEDRLRAVRLYIKLGKRVGLTIRQLGYPTKNALKHWHRQYEQRFDLSASYVRWPKYSQSQKELAVEHYLEHGRCLAATIKALGYPSRTLLPAWAQELHPETHTCVVVRTQELTHFLILMSPTISHVSRCWTRPRRHRRTASIGPSLTACSTRAQERCQAHQKLTCARLLAESSSITARASACYAAGVVLARASGNARSPS